ncbi:MAG TPA: hypothetical protein VHE79_14495, partial [Spirochaetia bacterium]
DEYQKSAMDSFRTDTIVPSVTHGAAASEAWVARIQDTMAIFVCDLNVDKAAAELAAAATRYAGGASPVLNGQFPQGTTPAAGQ